jgi:hypothetical protein
MSKQEWADFCKIAVSAIGFTGCLATIAGCVGVDTITLGSVTLPCTLVSGFICTAHPTAGAVLFDRYDKLMSYR